MANTAWNPADLSNVTLSGSNLIATVGAGSGGVRSVASYSSGKYYWECTYTTLNSNSIACGIQLASASLINATGTGIAFIARLTGQITINGAGVGTALGQIAAAAVI